jgi:hypothetical protein
MTGLLGCRRSKPRVAQERDEDVEEVLGLVFIWLAFIQHDRPKTARQSVRYSKQKKISKILLTSQSN